MNDFDITPDSDLLRAWAQRGDDAAFRALTERYAGMVYAVALRRLRDGELARDAAAEVFALMARKAATLTQPGCLASWLQRSAVLVAANAARREQRRDFAMNAYAASLTGDAPDASPAWRAALPHLDESLALLPERDRRLILARYFSGQSHGEIARQTGGSEEGVKKAGQRALERLSGILRRRSGSAVPLLLLTAGLAQELHAALPTGAAGKIAAAATAAAPHAGRLAILNHTLALMIHGKQLTAATALAVLCTLAGVGSYVAARHVVRVQDAPLPPAFVAEKISPNVTAAAAVPAAAVPRSIAEILDEAEKILRSGLPPYETRDRALILLTSLTPEQLRTGVKLVEARHQNTPTHHELLALFGLAWAQFDTAAAVTWMNVFPSPLRTAGDRGTSNIVIAWFKRDPQAAWKWWTDRCAAGAPVIDWPMFVGTGLNYWARRDPVAAMLAAGHTTTGAKKILDSLAEGLLDNGKFTADSPAMDAILRWDNPGLRTTLAMEIAESTNDLRGTLFPLLNKLCADDPAALESALTPRIRDWAKATPAEAAAWVLEQTAANSANTKHLLQPAIEEWHTIAPEAARTWLQTTAAQQPQHAERLQAIAEQLKN